MAPGSVHPRRAGEAAAALGEPAASLLTVRQLHGTGAAEGPRQPVKLLHGSLHPRGAQPGAADTPPGRRRCPQPMAAVPARSLPGPRPAAQAQRPGRLRACAEGQAGSGAQVLNSSPGEGGGEAYLRLPLS